MVCLGNICRSPLAKGILAKKIKDHQLGWEVDAAGTSGYHHGAQPHHGSIQVASRHGIEIEQFISRKLTVDDLDYFDLILVMDSENYREVVKICQNDQQRDKIKLILNYVYPGRNQAVPDPYYTGQFDLVYQLLEEATAALIDQLG